MGTIFKQGFLFWLLQLKVVSNLEVLYFTDYLSFGIYLVGKNLSYSQRNDRT